MYVNEVVSGFPVSIIRKKNISNQIKVSQTLQHQRRERGFPRTRWKSVLPDILSQVQTVSGQFWAHQCNIIFLRVKQKPLEFKKKSVLFCMKKCLKSRAGSVNNFQQEKKKYPIRIALSHRLRIHFYECILPTWYKSITKFAIYFSVSLKKRFY